MDDLITRIENAVTAMEMNLHLLLTPKHLAQYAIAALVIATVLFSINACKKMGRRYRLSARLRHTLSKARSDIITRHGFQVLQALLYYIGMVFAQTTLEQMGFSSWLIKTLSWLFLAWLLIALIPIITMQRKTGPIFKAIILLIAMVFILELHRPIAALLDGFGFDIDERRLSLLSLIQAGVTVFIIISLGQRCSDICASILKRGSTLDASAQILIVKGLRLLFITFGILTGLQITGLDMSTLAIFSGALGLGIGFGLQKVVSNLVSGVILLLDKSLKPGDVIEISTPSGQSFGWVTSLGARYTSIRGRDGIETLIPNETFISNPVTNWSFSDRIIRIRLPIGVSYKADIDLARKLCLEAIEMEERVLKDPEPRCFLTGFGDSSINLELRFWIADPEEGITNISSAINLTIWRKFRDHNVEIPFPQRDLHIKESLPVRIEKLS